MLVVHASDIHLDSPLVGLDRYEGCPAEAIRGAARRALAGLVSTAIDERADLVLVAGDLYDGAWRDYATGLFFVAQMRRLREAAIPVVLVRGNHDAESQITRHLRLPDNVVDLSTSEPQTVVLEGIDVAVHGQGFARRDVRDDLARRYPAPVAGCFNVGLLHTALSGREGHEPYAPTTVSVLTERGYDYWALGHVHRREVVSREPYVVFPGNLQGRNAREAGPKGATLVTVAGGRVTGLEHRAFDVVRWADCVVGVAQEDGRDDVVERAAARIAEALGDAGDRILAARVTLAGRTAAHGAFVENAEEIAADVRAAALDVGGDQVWVGEVRLETRTMLDLDALGAIGSELADPVAHLVRSLRSLAGDEGGLRELGASLSDLAEKLPEELRADPVAACLTDPAAMREVLADVEELLLGRIAAKSRSG